MPSLCSAVLFDAGPIITSTGASTTLDGFAQQRFGPPAQGDRHLATMIERGQLAWQVATTMVRNRQLKKQQRVDTRY